MGHVSAVVSKPGNMVKFEVNCCKYRNFAISVDRRTLAAELFF